MALCPFARIRLIPAGGNDPRIKAIGAVLHVDAGNAESLYSYFSGPSGGIESHFHVQKDGGIEQYRDTAYEADANYKGNSFSKDGRLCGLVSIETQGVEHGEWPSAQMASIKRLLTWLSQTHDFPLRKIPAWNGSGIGYHVMWGAPGPWTPVSKSCPGPDRIRQFNNELVPWMNGEEKEWWEMAIPDADKKDLARANWLTDEIIPQPAYDDRKDAENKHWTPANLLRAAADNGHSAQAMARIASNKLNDVRAQNRALDEKLTAVMAAMDGLDSAAILAKLDANHAEVMNDLAEAAAQRDALAGIVEQYADGSLDAEAVVRRIGELLMEGVGV